MIVYDRPTTKIIYGLPPEHEYGRWNGTFANGASMWRNMVNQKIKGLPGILNTTRILIIGCGLGLLIEGLKDEGFQRVWGISLDDYFASLWDQATCPVSDGTMRFIDPITKEQSAVPEGEQWPCEVRSDIRPLLGQFDIRTISNAQMRALTGTNNMRFDYILTEDVLTAYTEAEMVEVYNSCESWLAPNGRILHLLSLGFDGTVYSPPGAPPWTLAQWQASRPSHIFADISGVSQ